MQPSSCGKEAASVRGLCGLDNPIHTVWMAMSSWMEGVLLREGEGMDKKWFPQIRAQGYGTLLIPQLNISFQGILSGSRHKLGERQEFRQRIQSINGTLCHVTT